MIQFFILVGRDIDPWREMWGAPHASPWVGGQEQRVGACSWSNPEARGGLI